MAGCRRRGRYDAVLDHAFHVVLVDETLDRILVAFGDQQPQQHVVEREAFADRLHGFGR